MGPSQPLCLLFIFLALTTPVTVTGAQFSPVLDPPAELISDGQPAPDNVLFLPLTGSTAKQRIDGLLVPSKLWSRQQQVVCATNYTACQGSQYCCPDGNVCCSGGNCCGAGTYCTAVGGVQGCCRIGHVCNQIVNQCTVAGQVRCPNDSFCCAAGNACYRDANNNPRCSSASLSSTPTKPATHATPTGTSHPLQTMCRLKPQNSQGLFSRRRRGPVHPASNRRRWF